MTDLEIREVRVEDAASILDLLMSVTSEPDAWVMSAPGEVTLTVEQEEKILADLIAAPTSQGFVACAPHVVGVLLARGGNKERIRHNVTLAVHVLAGYRDQGLGRRLIERALTWAREHELVTRVELSVASGNERGIHLYRKLGFETEGIKRSSYRKDGELHDEHLMAILL